MQFEFTTSELMALEGALVFYQGHCVACIEKSQNASHDDLERMWKGRLDTVNQLLYRLPSF